MNLMNVQKDITKDRKAERRKLSYSRPHIQVEQNMTEVDFKSYMSVLRLFVLILKCYGVDWIEKGS